MKSRLHFDLFMQEMRNRTLEAVPKQLPHAGTYPIAVVDVGAVRLSHIEAAIREKSDAADPE